MRSPLRIGPFLKALEEVWSLPEFADERFGQFVMNLTRDEQGRFQDPWEWENSRWREALEKRRRESHSHSIPPEGT